MNLKVRLRNAAFWIAFIPVLVAFIYSTLALFGKAPSISEAVVVKVLQEIISILAIFGVLNDPTTAGIKDSERAMTYEVPYSSKPAAQRPLLNLFKTIFKRKEGDK